MWDMSQSWERPPTAAHTLHTAYPVRRIAWRPGHPTELVVVPIPQSLSVPEATHAPNESFRNPASSTQFTSRPQSPQPAPHSSDVVAHLEIWDVRRHYISKYSLPTSDGVAVDLAWGGELGDDDPDKLVVAYQNGMFGQFGTVKRSLPLESVSRQVVAWSSQGELAYGVDVHHRGEVPFDDL